MRNARRILAAVSVLSIIAVTIGGLTAMSSSRTASPTAEDNPQGISPGKSSSVAVGAVGDAPIPDGDVDNRARVPLERALHPGEGLRLRIDLAAPAPLSPEFRQLP